MEARRCELGDVTLQRGQVLPSAQITYVTYGSLSPAGDNAVLIPTWFAGTHAQAHWMIGEGRALDPAKYFIVVADILGNGQSSSPSNTPKPFDRRRFPHVTVLDNVLLQRRLLREELGVERLALILGRSMGAQIAYQWASYFADEVDRFIPLCGSAKTAAHNYAFLSTVKACITADPAWQGGEYGIQPMSGIRMMRTVFDTWGVGQGFFRAGLHLGDRFATTQQFLDRSDDRAIGDANDLLAQVWTWENADLSANDKFEGDVAQALSAITAKAIVMPGRHDLYFPPEDSEIEVAGMRNAELRVIDSLWGHRSAAPGSDPRDIAVLEQALTDILAR